ncbi:MAG: PqqD family protein [Eubacterium sp.]|nr:PqqD family protein [Eubacterium sp.]
MSKKIKAKKPVKLAPNYLDQVFIRDPDKHWELRPDGTAVVDLEHRGFFARIAQTVFKKPKVSHIALDKYGSVVWKHLDGSHTAGDVIRIMEETFPEEKDRMLNRTVTFLGTLQSQGFIISAQ